MLWLLLLQSSRCMGLVVAACGLSSCDLLAVGRAGFSCWSMGTLKLWLMRLQHAGFSSYDLRALEHRLSMCSTWTQ